MHLKIILIRYKEAENFDGLPFVVIKYKAEHEEKANPPDKAEKYEKGLGLTSAEKYGGINKMKYSFDEIIDRRNTDSVKYALWQGNSGDLLPLWVADMDFKSPPEVSEVLIQKCRHGIFGYSDAYGEDYFNPLYDWYLRRFNWELHPEWLVKTPGVVFAIYAAVRALTNEGDAVLIQQPVYYPFERAIKDTGRKVVVSELVYGRNGYSVDFKDFEDKVVKNSVKLFILCSPHNPVGRVWTKKELMTFGDICLKHGVFVVADEIHEDFVYPGNRHTVFAGIKPEFADMTVTCTAPTKTFNLAGLQISNIFISNESIRQKFCSEIRKTGYGAPSLMGIAACKAAYQYGEEWLEELKEYLSLNLDFAKNYLKENIPEIRLVEPEGTYLLWMDCRGLGLSDEKLDEMIAVKAGLWLDSGTMFGAGGQGFQRMNIACPRQILKQAMERLKSAFKSN